MTNDVKIRYWDDGSILVEASNWDCFLRNEALNPMINWLNLHRGDIESGEPCEWLDKVNDVIYLSVYGSLMIKTNRDVVFLSKEQREQFIVWLKEHKDLLSIREVFP